jgi:hypothetical protein
MSSSRRLPSQLFLLGAVLAFCVASRNTSTAQSSPSAPASQVKTKIIPLDQVPTVIRAVLAPSNMPSGGAMPDISCVLEENVSVEIINGVKVEVHECDDPTKGGVGGGGAGAGFPPAGPSGPSGIPQDPEACQLFATTLKRSCAELPAAQRAGCLYNACVQGASCTQQPATTCGPRPKVPPKPNVVACPNTYAANFNGCTIKFRTLDGQNACLYAAGQALSGCMASPVPTPSAK